MSFFKDVNGREWRIRLTGAKLGEIREATGISLAATSGEAAVAATAACAAASAAWWRCTATWSRKPWTGPAPPRLTTRGFHA